MFEITWHKIWCIMNECRDRKLIIHGNNELVYELGFKLRLIDIEAVDIIITDDEKSLEELLGHYTKDLKEKIYIISTISENEKKWINIFEQNDLQMFRDYRMLKDMELADYLLNTVAYFKKSIKTSNNKDRNELKLFVITHKECSIPNLPIYYRLFVGNYGNDFPFYLKDNKGDNISNKNTSYCELTGLYWIWKNIKADYVGICHYRRYFYDDEGNALDKNSILMLLKEYDIILPQPMIFKSTKKRHISGKLDIITHYQQEHYIADLLFAKEYIEENYSDYIGAFNKAMSKRELYGCNMFITSKELYDKYCEWLFPIIFALEAQRCMVWEDSYQKRVYGFLAERLFNVWLERYNFKTKKINVIVGEYKENNK